MIKSLSGQLIKTAAQISLAKTVFTPALGKGEVGRLR